MKNGSRCLLLALIPLAFGSAMADWDPSLPAKWVQLPDLSPLGLDVNAGASMLQPVDYYLADDFECRETGPITGIHLFGSWLHDELPPGQDPQGIVFTLCFYSDIPASPGQPSMPGTLLWQRVFQPGEFNARIWAANIMEGWLDPPQRYEFPADWTCWQYNFEIPAPEAFHQQGSPAEPVVYWLGVHAQPVVLTALFGWKTSPDHWNDDAVWRDQAGSVPGDWRELIYPPGHELYGQSIDLAFVLTGEPPFQEADWGDAPDNAAGVGYPTLAANNGAFHRIDWNVYLGPDAAASIDAEPDGQPDPNALGDDNDGNDDEDGVTFSVLRPGKDATIEVIASVDGFIDAWIDFNVDGDWDDADDQIFSAEPVVAGTSTRTFTVSAGAIPNSVTFARVRFSTVGGLPVRGGAPDGEVEDHEVEILDNYVMKWHQRPDLSFLGLDVDCSLEPRPLVLADDFLCTGTGALTDFFIYGSWLGDYLPFGQDPLAVKFTLSIHADNPAAPPDQPYSQPGELLWLHEFDPGTFSAERFMEQIVEGWLDPPDGYLFPADWTCWRYHFHVNPHLAFWQEGSPDEPVVYWLDVQAEVRDPVARFGWKTSREHWNDDAVWGEGREPYAGPWFELRYPPGHELFGQSIDLAFAVFEDLVTAAPAQEMPPHSQLHQNIPNPFNPQTEIRYDLPAGGGRVRLDIFDIKGHRVRTLVDAVQAGGAQRVFWNGLDDGDHALPSGIYFYRLRAPGCDTAMKMILLR